MSEYTLYCFDKSGNSYKAALLMNLAKADWSPRFVDFFNGETKTPEYRKLNIMGEAPLLIHNEQVFSQSGVILNYLSESLNKYGPKNDAERNEILRWLLFDNHKLTSYTATLRFLRTFTDQGENEVTKFLEARSKGALSVLNTHLEINAFAVGERLTIADFSMCGYLYYRDEIGIDFSEYPNILRWLGDIEAQDGWQHPYDLMPSE
ncbi:MAG: glutathione S-transferase [Parasphingorhabdus sp.]|jgi:glutathione S-transferase